MANNRNAAADFAKGIAILMVIVGHFQVATPLHLQRLAYTFHMPLFFFLAGAFFRPKPVMKALKSDATRLLLPLLVTFAGYKVFCWAAGEADPLHNAMMALLHNAPSPEFHAVWPGDLTSIGILWFILTLFWCKQLYNVVYQLITPPHSSRQPYIAALTGLAVGVGAHFSAPYIWLPLGLTQGLAAMLYYSIGNLTADMLTARKPSRLMLGCCLAVWLAAFLIAPYRGIACEPYLLMVLSVAGAWGATVCLVSLGSAVGNSALGRGLQWCGRNSMGIYCSHALCFGVVYWILNQPGLCAPWGETPTFLFQMAFCLSLTALMCCLPWTRQLFGLSQLRKNEQTQRA